MSQVQIETSPSLKPSLSYPSGTILDCIAEAVRLKPDHPALIYKGRSISYAELDRLSDAFATALLSHGVQRGQRVALLLPNIPQFLIAELGTFKAGAVVAAMNPLYTARELEQLFRAVEPTVAVAYSAIYETLSALRGMTSLEWIVAANVKDFLPPMKRVAFTVLLERRGGHRPRLASGDAWMSDLLRTFAGAGRPAIEVKPDDPALILFTGGTTGVPKGAVGTHAAFIASGTQLQHWFRPALNDWQDTLLQLMPLFHVYGNLGVSATALVGHNTLALVPNPRDIDDVVETIRTVKPAFVPGVPTLFNALLNHPRVRSGKVDFRSVRLCICGAAPLMSETKQRFENLTGGRVVEGYALTESMMASIIEPVDKARKPGSIGLPVHDVEVRILDENDGHPLAPGEVGELVMRAPQLMQGYWNADDATGEMLRDGWLHTGDIAYADDEGYLFIVDRAKDVIKPSGFQVWPREVEEILATHPAVTEVAVAGIPDTIQGESVKAWVVTKPELKVTPDQLRSYCRERMAAYKVPVQFEFMEALPKSHVGKILKRELVKK